MGTFDKYLYSDSYSYDTVPKSKLFPMCVIPPAPCKLSIYKQEQTEDKMFIKYSNPLYNSSVESNTINLIDVCLIAKDQTGKLLNKNGNVSKSEIRKRDGLNGKTWIYYSDRQWHNIVPSSSNKTNNKKEFEMVFDISKYPKGTCFAIVAFYYPDYWNHPSIYSTSNIININKSNIQMNLKIQEPTNGSTSPTANPTFKVRVSKGATGGYEYTSIYEDYNLATSWDKDKWEKNPVWFRVPRTKNEQMPNFTMGTVYVNNQPNKQSLSEPSHYIERYYKNKDIYQTASYFRISGASINDEGSFKENALFLRANNNNEVHLGDIETSTLLSQGYIDFTWTQKTGRFLSIGENKIEAFTTPYLYDMADHGIDYLEQQSYWISDTTLYSMPIMPYNPFRDSIVKPSNESWEKVEGDILRIKIPYALFKPNKEYQFKFSRFVDEGFYYDEIGTISDSDVANLCSSYVYVNMKHGGNLTGVNYNKERVIYSPAYRVSSNINQLISAVNNYNKWITQTIKFTTPSKEKLIELDENNQAITIDISVRGISIIKLKDLTLNSTDGSHNIDTNKGNLDKSVRENVKSIKVLYQGSIDIDFGYINPLNCKDMMDLRDYLKAIGTIYGVTIDPKWRTLVKDQSYLMARDFNDTKDHCKSLFTAIKNKFPTTFHGDPNEFDKLPTIKVGDTRGKSTSYSSRGKHYFPEWDDLIDTIKKVLNTK